MTDYSLTDTLFNSERATEFFLEVMSEQGYFYESGKYGREMGRISPEGNIYGQTRTIREIVSYWWWDGVQYQYLQVAGEAASFSQLPQGTARPFGQIWRVPSTTTTSTDPRYRYDYYLWGSENEQWIQMVWFYDVEIKGNLPNPGLQIGAAHRFIESNIRVVWDGYTWQRAQKHSTIQDDEPERHLPEGLFRFFVNDVEVFYVSKREIALRQVSGGSGEIPVKNEVLVASDGMSVFNSCPVIQIYENDDITVSYLEPLTEYFIYLANNQDERFSAPALPGDNEHNPTPEWDFRGKLFLCRMFDEDDLVINDPHEGYLYETGLGSNARYVGKMETDNTPASEGGPFFRRVLNISDIHKSPNFIELVRNTSDFAAQISSTSPWTMIVERVPGTTGQVFIPDALVVLDGDFHMHTWDNWLEVDPVTETLIFHECGINSDPSTWACRAGHTTWAYVALPLDEFNFNATNPSTGRPWRREDPGSDGVYSREKDFRLRPFWSRSWPEEYPLRIKYDEDQYPKIDGQYRMGDTWPLYHTRAVLVTSCPKNPANLAFFDVMGTTSFMGYVSYRTLSDFVITPSSASEFLITKKQGTHGRVSVGNQYLEVKLADDDDVDVISNNWFVALYNETAEYLQVRSSTTKVVDSPNTTLYLYLASDAEVFDCVSYVNSDWLAANEYHESNVVASSESPFALFCLVGGVSSASAPSWPSEEGEIVEDGTVVWVAMRFNYAGAMFFCSTPPSDGYLSRGWPGCFCRWLATIKTDENGEFTGYWLIDTPGDATNILLTQYEVAEQLQSGIDMLSGHADTLDYLLGYSSGIETMYLEISADLESLGELAESLGSNWSLTEEVLSDVYSDLHLLDSVVDDLGEDLLSLSGNVDSLSDVLESIEGDVSEIGDDITSLYAVTSELDDNVVELGIDVSQLSDITSDILEDYVAISLVTDELGSDVGSLRETASALSEDIYAVSGLASQLFDVTDSLISDTSELGYLLSELSEDIDGVGNIVGSLEFLTSDLEDDVGSLYVITSQLGVDISDVSNLASGIGAVTDELVEDVSDLRVDLDSLSVVGDALDNLYNSLSTTVDGLGMDITSLSGIYWSLDSNLDDVFEVYSEMGSDLAKAFSAMSYNSDQPWLVWSAFDEVASDYASLSDELDDVQTDVSLLSGSVSHLSGRHNALSGIVVSLSGALDTLDGAVNELEEDYQEISGDVTSLSGFVFSLSEEVSDLIGDYLSLSGVVSEIDATVSGLDVLTDSLSEAVDELWDDYGSLSGFYDTLSGHVSSVSVLALSLSQAVDELEGDWISLSGVVDGVENDLGSLSDYVDNLSVDVYSLSAITSELGVDYASLSGNLTTLSGAIDDLSGDWYSLSGDVDSAFTLYNTISGNLTETIEDLYSLSDLLSDLSGDVDSLSGLLDVASGLIDGTQELVEELSGDFISLRDELSYGYVGGTPKLITYDALGRRFQYADQKIGGLYCTLSFESAESLRLSPVSNTRLQVVCENLGMIEFTGNASLRIFDSSARKHYKGGSVLTKGDYQLSGGNVINDYTPIGVAGGLITSVTRPLSYGKLYYVYLRASAGSLSSLLSKAGNVSVAAGGFGYKVGDIVCLKGGGSGDTIGLCRVASATVLGTGLESLYRSISYGSDYEVGDILELESVGPEEYETGRATVTEVFSQGALDSNTLTVVSPGSGYKTGDVVTLLQGTEDSATIRVDSVTEVGGGATAVEFTEYILGPGTFKLESKRGGVNCYITVTYIGGVPTPTVTAPGSRYKYGDELGVDQFGYGVTKYIVVKATSTQGEGVKEFTLLNNGSGYVEGSCSDIAKSSPECVVVDIPNVISEGGVKAASVINPGSGYDITSGTKTFVKDSSKQYGYWMGYFNATPLGGSVVSVSSVSGTLAFNSSVGGYEVNSSAPYSGSLPEGSIIETAPFLRGCIGEVSKISFSTYGSRFADNTTLTFTSPTGGEPLVVRMDLFVDYTPSWYLIGGVWVLSPGPIYTAVVISGGSGFSVGGTFTYGIKPYYSGQGSPTQWDGYLELTVTELSYNTQSTNGGGLLLSVSANSLDCDNYYISDQAPTVNYERLWMRSSGLEPLIQGVEYCDSILVGQIAAGSSFPNTCLPTEQTPYNIQSTHSSSTVYNLLDRQSTTYWSVNDVISEESPIVVTIRSIFKKRVTGFFMANRAINDEVFTEHANSPKDYKIEGSFDGTVWHTLYTDSGSDIGSITNLRTDGYATVHQNYQTSTYPFQFVVTQGTNSSAIVQANRLVQIKSGSYGHYLLDFSMINSGSGYNTTDQVTLTPYTNVNSVTMNTYNTQIRLHYDASSFFRSGTMLDEDIDYYNFYRLVITDTYGSGDTESPRYCEIGDFALKVPDLASPLSVLSTFQQPPVTVVTPVSTSFVSRMSLENAILTSDPVITRTGSSHMRCNYTGYSTTTEFDISLGSSSKSYWEGGSQHVITASVKVDTSFSKGTGLESNVYNVVGILTHSSSAQNLDVTAASGELQLTREGHVFKVLTV